ncbi:ATP-binding cassette sub-family A member 13 [Folsomia candida]|uniref:ATP-binding cassette sub-family A member 13 n=1 Tax=Folsomia candida TaxID=158441 RepID=A0A226D610_FOLCA|nr:ATP-binding cassette sub-family A member 13 [Folsomia candida]
MISTLAFSLILLLQLSKNNWAVPHVHHSFIYLPEFNNYFKIFQNCTVIVLKPKHVYSNLANLKGNNVPLILAEHIFNTRSGTIANLIERKISLQKRRNPSHYCWTSFVLFPEASKLLKISGKYWESTFNSYSFIRNTLPHQYFIRITSVRKDIQANLKKRPLFTRNYFGLRQIIIIDISEIESGILMHYYNNYHLHGNLANSLSWYKIHCGNFEPHQCFHQLDLISRNVSQLNKYFWRAAPAQLKSMLHVRSLVNKFTLKSHRAMYHAIISVTNFHEFRSFWLLQDILRNDNPYYIHFVPNLRKLTIFKATPYFSFILRDVQTFSFVSCYKVKPESFTGLASLISPFDLTGWIYFSASFILVTLILSLLPVKPSLYGFFFVIWITLENSGSENLTIFQARFHGRKHVLGFYMVISLWIILIGTILTNWYKTSFTMELILPVEYRLPWKSILDLDGIRVLVPYNLLDKNYVDETSQPNYMQYAQFYVHVYERAVVLARYAGNSTVLKGYRKVAKALVAMIEPKIGIAQDGEYYGNGTFNDLNGTGESLNFPKIMGNASVQPIFYGDSVELVKSLSTCDKIGYMDTQENVDALLPFLNDQHPDKKYLRGDDDTFFTLVLGWVMLPVRDNYVEGRLKVMISSGIYAHWEEWYRLVKPPKLFHNYVNWTKPKFSAVSRLDFSSKISAGFYVLGICLVGCVISFGMELTSKRVMRSWCN